MSAAPGRPKQARTAARQGEGIPLSAAPGRPKQARTAARQGEGIPLSAAPGRPKPAHTAAREGEGPPVALELRVRNRRTAVLTLLAVTLGHALALAVVLNTVTSAAAGDDRVIPQRPAPALNRAPSTELVPMDPSHHLPHNPPLSALPPWIVRAQATDAPAPWLLTPTGQIAWRADQAPAALGGYR
jgi:hypothetical protein